MPIREERENKRIIGFGEGFSILSMTLLSSMYTDRKTLMQGLDSVLTDVLGVKARSKLVSNILNRVSLMRDKIASERMVNNQTPVPNRIPLIDIKSEEFGTDTKWEVARKEILEMKEKVNRKLDAIRRDIEVKYSILPSERHDQVALGEASTDSIARIEKYVKNLERDVLRKFEPDAFYIRLAESVVQKMRARQIDIQVKAKDVVELINGGKGIEDIELLTDFKKELERFNINLDAVRTINSNLLTTARNIGDYIQKINQNNDIKLLLSYSRRSTITRPLENIRLFSSSQGVEILNINVSSINKSKLLESLSITSSDPTKPISLDLIYKDKKLKPLKNMLKTGTNMAVLGRKMRNLMWGSAVTSNDYASSFNNVFKSILEYGLDEEKKTKIDPIENIRIVAMNPKTGGNWSGIKSTWFDFIISLKCKGPQGDMIKDVPLRLGLPVGPEYYNGNNIMVNRRLDTLGNNELDTARSLLEYSKAEIVTVLQKVRDNPNDIETIMKRLNKKLEEYSGVYASGSNAKIYDSASSIIPLNNTRTQEVAKEAIEEYYKFERLRKKGTEFAIMDTEYTIKGVHGSKGGEIYEMTITIADFKKSDGTLVIKDSKTYFLPRPGHEVPRSSTFEVLKSEDDLAKIVYDYFHTRAITIDGRHYNNLRTIAHSWSFAEGKVLPQLLGNRINKEGSLLRSVLNTTETMNTIIDIGKMELLSPASHGLAKGEDMPRVIDSIIKTLPDPDQREKLNKSIDKFLVDHGIPVGNWRGLSGARFVGAEGGAHWSRSDNFASGLLLMVIDNIIHGSKNKREDVISMLTNYQSKLMSMAKEAGLSQVRIAKEQKTLINLDRIIPNNTVFSHIRPLHRFLNGLDLGYLQPGKNGTKYIQTLPKTIRNLISVFIDDNRNYDSSDPFYTNITNGMKSRVYYTDAVAAGGSGLAIIPKDLMSFEPVVRERLTKVNKEIKIGKTFLPSLVPLGTLDGNTVFTKVSNVGSLKPQEIIITNILDEGLEHIVEYQVAYKPVSGRSKFAGDSFNIITKILGTYRKEKYLSNKFAKDELATFIVNQDIFKSGEGPVINAMLANLARYANLLPSGPKRLRTLILIKQAIKKHLTPDEVLHITESSPKWAKEWGKATGATEGGSGGLGVLFKVLNDKEQTLVLGLPGDPRFFKNYEHAEEWKQAANVKLTYANILRVVQDSKVGALDLIGDKLEDQKIETFMEYITLYSNMIKSMAHSSYAEGVSELKKWTIENKHIQDIDNIIADYEEHKNGKLTGKYRVPWMYRAMSSGRTKEVYGEIKKLFTEKGLLPGIGIELLEFKHSGVIGKKYAAAFATTEYASHGTWDPQRGLGMGKINIPLEDINKLMFDYPHSPAAGKLASYLLKETFAQNLPKWGLPSLAQELSTYSYKELEAKGYVNMFKSIIKRDKKTGSLEFRDFIDRFSKLTPITGIGDIYIDGSGNKLNSVMAEAMYGGIDGLNEALAKNQVVKMVGEGRTYSGLSPSDINSLRNFWSNKPYSYIPLSPIVKNGLNININGQAHTITHIPVINHSINSEILDIGHGRVMSGPVTNIMKQLVELAGLSTNRDISAAAQKAYDVAKTELASSISGFLTNSNLILNKNISGRFNGTSRLNASPELKYWNRRFWNKEVESGTYGNGWGIRDINNSIDMRQVKDITLKLNSGIRYINNKEASRMIRAMSYDEIIKMAQTTMEAVTDAPAYMEGPEGPRMKALQEFRMVSEFDDAKIMRSGKLVDKFKLVKRSGQFKNKLGSGSMMLNPYQLLKDIASGNTNARIMKLGSDVYQENVKFVLQKLSDKGFLPSGWEAMSTKQPWVWGAKMGGAFLYGDRSVAPDSQFEQPFLKMISEMDDDGDFRAALERLNPSLVEFLRDQNAKKMGPMSYLLRNIKVPVKFGGTNLEYDSSNGSYRDTGHILKLQTLEDIFSGKYKSSTATILPKSAEGALLRLGKKGVQILNPMENRFSFYLSMLMNDSASPRNVEVQRLWRDVVGMYTEQSLQAKGGIRGEGLMGNKIDVLTYNKQMVENRINALSQLHGLTMGSLSEPKFNDLKKVLCADELTSSVFFFDSKVALPQVVQDFKKAMLDNPKIQEIFKNHNVPVNEQTPAKIMQLVGKGDIGSKFEKAFGAMGYSWMTKSKQDVATVFGDAWGIITQNGGLDNLTDNMKKFLGEVDVVAQSLATKAGISLQGIRERHYLKEVEFMKNINLNENVQRIASKFTKETASSFKSLALFGAAAYFLNPNHSKFLGHMPGTGGEESDWEWSTNERRFDNIINEPYNPYDKYRVRFKQDRPQQYLKSIKRDRIRSSMGYDFLNDTAGTSLIPEQQSNTYYY